MGRLSASVAGFVLHNRGVERGAGPLGSEVEAETLKEPICFTGRSDLCTPVSSTCIRYLGAIGDSELVSDRCRSVASTGEE